MMLAWNAVMSGNIQSGAKTPHLRARLIKDTGRLMARRSVYWLLLVFGLLAYHPAPTQVVSSDNARLSNQWLREHLLNPNSQVPFSFVYGRQSSKTLLKAWPE